MKPLHLNLAAKPLEDYRPVYAVVVATSILIAFLMLNNIDTYVRYVHDTKTTRTDIAATETQIANEHRRAENAQKQISTIDLVTMSKETKFINTQLAQRAFSWSELLDHLEAVLPTNVRITSITPTFSEGGIVHLSMAFEAKTADGLLITMNGLQRDPSFTNAFPTNQDNSQTGYRFGLSVDYHPSIPLVVR